MHTYRTTYAPCFCTVDVAILVAARSINSFDYRRGRGRYETCIIVVHPIRLCLDGRREDGADTGMETGSAD